jgi:hypothetical protein
VSYAAMAGTPTFDLLIVGGGIKRAGIARDAAGRGLKVLLVEKDDLAAHTSSASTKLIHGGLRYLEQLEFRLVRESLVERERLWSIAPHIIRPLEFVMPQTGATRPASLVRLGLFLYDHLGGRKRLPRPARSIWPRMRAETVLRTGPGKHSPMRTVRSTTAGSSFSMHWMRPNAAHASRRGPSWSMQSAHQTNGRRLCSVRRVKSASQRACW